MKKQVEYIQDEMLEWKRIASQSTEMMIWSNLLINIGKPRVALTNEQMRKFVQTRLDPVLEKGYYSTIVDKDINSLTAKRIRDSYIYFRSSSRPGALEGIDIDYL